MGMTTHECITWLKILRANCKTFYEINADKKIEALDMAIKMAESREKIQEELSKYEDTDAIKCKYIKQMMEFE